MKKRIVIIAGCTIILSISSIAHGAKGPYVSGNLGLAVLSDSDLTDSTTPGITANIESDSGLALGVAAGYDLGNNIKVEGEIAYQKNDLDKASVFGVDVDLAGDTSSLAFLLNGYYDFVNESVFTPFVSTGLGFAKVEINDFNVPGSGLPSYNDDDTVFAYQVGAGVDYAVNEKITIDFKYRYLGASDPEFDTSTVEYASHNFYAGIRAAF
jgi:opacity protein-like surface antigen